MARQVEVIRVLQSWQEVGEAILSLQREGLPAHHTAQKNWDHFLLYNVIKRVERQATIVDLGCGEGYTLAFLHALGFKNIYGVDYRIDQRLGIKRLLTQWRQKTLKSPYHLLRGDITNTRFQAGSVDVAISISTIEHSVDIEGFFAEARRILKPGGLLFLTTDYWEEKIATDSNARAFGLGWKVFCRDQVENMVETASSLGLTLVDKPVIPRCSDRTVFWQNAGYTFIAMLFVKEAEACASR